MRGLLAHALVAVSFAGAAAAQTFLTVSLPQGTGWGEPAYLGSEYFRQEVSQPWNLTVSNPTTLRFEIRQGDYSHADYTGVQRTELNQGQDISRLYQPGIPFTFQWDQTVLPGLRNTSQWVVLFQLAYPYKGQRVWDASPNVSLGYIREQFYLGIRYTTVPGRCTPEAQTRKHLWQGPVIRGQTYRFRVRMLFDANDSNGRVQAWLNGAQIANYSGPLGCAEFRSHYPSFGIYRAKAPETLVTTMGNFQIIRNDTSPAPVPKPTPAPSKSRGVKHQDVW